MVCIGIKPIIGLSYCLTGVRGQAWAFIPPVIIVKSRSRNVPVCLQLLSLSSYIWLLFRSSLLYNVVPLVLCVFYVPCVGLQVSEWWFNAVSVTEPTRVQGHSRSYPKHTFKLPHLDDLIRPGSLIRKKVKPTAVLQLLCDFAYCVKWLLQVTAIRLLFRGFFFSAALNLAYGEWPYVFMYVYGEIISSGMVK